MSSSMRNAVQRRNHKERAQPLNRSRHGLLEKHSDYALRAADHRAKKKRIKILREKARDRNPDEFNFGMVHGQMGKDGTRIGDRGNTALDQETVALLKTQDEGYLRTVIGRTRREIEKVVGSLKVRKDGSDFDVLGDLGTKGQRTLFVTSAEEQNAYRKDGQDEDGGDDSEDADDNSEIDMKARKTSQSSKSTTARSKSRQKEERKLEALKRRQTQLIIAQRELDLQRAKMSNSVGGINKNGVKFKIRERKR